jgi:hypothetical protein
MRKTYERPMLVEFGTVEKLTLGSGGNLPDFAYDGQNLNLINNTCDASAPATACLVVGS